MEKTTLVLMAAGLGSRFGSTKQLAEVGGNGEAILDFTIRDAQAAGIAKIVIIVRSEIESNIRSHIDNLHGSNHNCVFICQDEFGPHRDKPWGTTHAVLSASKAIQEDSAFLLANADDYYGPSSLKIAAENLPYLSSGTGMLITFELSRTLPQTGEVTRAICQVEDGRLKRIVETSNIGNRSDGKITAGATGASLNSKTPVSLNMWGFHSSIMALLEQQWGQFISKNESAEDSECLLPESVRNIMANGDLLVNTFPSEEIWTGLTNPEDYEVVRATLSKLRSE
ncbi:MAG: hypothetical protein CL470_05590 [Acidimicrobiaceae bacterium]|nr:hypothetical protein [Acidimicrobiaceae bacterium]|tara:strand:+ start:1333 stop:2181 length:849 start_codon:yes stop_codon:yes gene_type:complete